MDSTAQPVTTNSPAYRFITTADQRLLSEIVALYQSAGWWAPERDTPQLVDRIIRGSHCFLIASHNSRVIGMGRAISDGASDAYIQDVTVQEPFRNQGIGRIIIQHLMSRLKADGIQWIGLVAENDSRDFYTPLGFRPMTRATPMVAIIP